jgi:hypothetical protein
VAPLVRLIISIIFAPLLSARGALAFLSQQREKFLREQSRKFLREVRQ